MLSLGFRPSPLSVLLVLAWLGAVPQLALAQRDTAFLATNPESLLAATLDSLPGDRLELDRALELAVANAPEVGQALAGVEAAEGEVRREKGAFDPELFASILRESNDQPVVSPFQTDPIQTDLTTTGGGARMQLPFGTELEASLNTTRIETNSFFTVLNPEYDTFGLLSIRQPLLAGFGPAARAELSSAERRLEAAMDRHRDAVLRTEASTENAYWDVYAAERDLAVAQVIRDRAQAFVVEAETRARAGILGPSAVANARVFLAEQELAALDSEERLDAFSDRLCSLMGIRPQGGAPRFRSVDRPAEEHGLAPVDDLVAEALGRNHEIRAQRANVEQLRALARGASWDALPTLDFVGSLGANGLSGTPPDSVSTEFDGGFGTTWDQVWDRDFPYWSVGLELTLPLGRREGRGERDRLRAEVVRAEKILEANENSLEENIRRAHRELLHGEERLRAARDGVNAALEQVRVGAIEFRHGRTTAFELVRLGEDVATSQERFSQALVSAAKAASELRYLTSGAYDGEQTR